MSLRDPADDRDMPPNGNDFVSALCLRGVRKVDSTSLISPLLLFSRGSSPFFFLSLSVGDTERMEGSCLGRTT